MPSVLAVFAIMGAAMQLSSVSPGSDAGGPFAHGETVGRPRLLEAPLTLAVLSRSNEGAMGDLDASSGAASEELRLRHLRTWERGLKWATAGSLLVTSTLGALVAINQPTAFGDGRCFTAGSPIFGTYGCDRGLSTLHGISGVMSATLYTANGVLALSIPGPVGNVSETARPWHRALTYVHLGGIILQPILGLVSAYPQVIGMQNTGPTDTFPRTTRTVHLFLGIVTTAAYLATLALEQ